MCLLTMCSGYRKGPREDDGFWEVYNLHFRSHILLTASLVVVSLLWIAPIIIYITATMTTFDEVRFFEADLP